VVSAIVGGIAGVVWLWCALVVLSSRISTDPGSDPHGFGVIFGLVFGVPAGLVCWSMLPASLPPRRRDRGRRVLAATFLVLLGLQLLALFAF
jgi:hypothetical protein